MPLRGARVHHFVAAVLLAAWMLAPQGVTSGSIVNTVHDFSLATGANTPYRDTTGTATVCNTCHIPHSSGIARPLWNHTLSNVTYSWGEVTTLAGTTLPTAFNAPAGGTSKACLSCHDGTVAIGDVAKGVKWGTKLIPNFYKITGVNNSAMTGNHPVGVPYPNPGGSYNGITTQATAAKYQASPTTARIYGVSPDWGIECGSCHDPHDISYGSFLRMDQSTLCTDCHNM